MRLYLWILSRILPSYEADSPVSAYASVDASSDSALAETSLSLVAADSASERIDPVSRLAAETALVVPAPAP